MKAENQFISEQADKVFQVVAKTFASAGGVPDAITQIKEILYTVSTYSKKCTIADVLHRLENFSGRIEQM